MSAVKTRPANQLRSFEAKKKENEKYKVPSMLFPPTVRPCRSAAAE